MSVVPAAHELDMRYNAANPLLSTLVQGTGPDAAGGANAAFNGPNLRLVDPAAVGIPIPSGMDLMRLKIGPGDSRATGQGPPLYDVTTFPKDPAMPGFNVDNPVGPAAYYRGQAWHMHSEDYYYRLKFLIPGKAYDPADPATGSFDSNDAGRPYLRTKIYEVGHADSYTDGAVGGFPYFGHNAMGMVLTWNRTDAAGGAIPEQFTPRPGPSSPPPGGFQTTDPNADWFKPKFVDRGDGKAGPGTDTRAYYTVTVGRGDVSAHDNTEAWALREVVPDQLMSLIFRIKRQDYDGVVDTTAGRIQIWLFTEAELASATTSTPARADYTGSTNQYVATASGGGATAAFDPDNPAASLSDSPQRLLQRPDFLNGLMIYNGQTQPSHDFTLYGTTQARRFTLAAALADLTGNIAASGPTNATPPSIMGSAVEGNTLTGNPGGWGGSPAPTLSYQWIKNGTVVATSLTYVLPGGSAGAQVTFKVTAINPSGTAFATSTAVTVQAATSLTIVREWYTSFQAFGTSDSQPVVLPTVANRLLLFHWQGKTGADSLTMVTANGAPLTLLASRSQNSVRIEMWGLNNPPAGPVTLAWVKNGSAQNVVWGAELYSGVDQTTGVGGTGQTGATQDPAGGLKSLTVASVTGRLIVTSAAFNGAPTTIGPTPGGTLSGAWSRNQSTTQGGSASIAGASSVSVGWTPSGGPNYDWAILAASLIPAAVIAAAPTIQQLPVITGNPVEGQLLTASDWVFDEHGAATTYALQWLLCDSAGNNPTNISGANGPTFLLPTGDIGHRIRFKVTATNSGGPTPATSAATAVITAAGVPPANTSPPTITGTAEEGQQVIDYLGTWTGNPDLTRQWMRCDAAGTIATAVPITNATGVSYLEQPDDVGHTLRLRVAGQNAAGIIFAFSDPTAVVTASADVTRPSVAGYAIDSVIGTSGTLSILIHQDAKYLQWFASDFYLTDVVSVAVNGVPMTRIETGLNNDNTSGLDIWELKNPPTGQVTITYQLGSIRGVDVQAIAYKNCDAVHPIGTISVLAGTGGSPAITAASVDNSLAVAVLTYKSAMTTAPVEPPEQTALASIETVAGGFSTRTAASTKDGSDPSTALQWSIVPPDAGWTVAAMAINPVAIPAAPVNTDLPSLSGTFRVGQTVTVDLGDWNNVDVDTRYDVQLMRDSQGDGLFTAIPGAKALTYTQQAADSGCKLKVRVTASTAGGSQTVDSVPVGPVSVLFALNLIDDWAREPVEDPLSDAGAWAGPVENGTGQLKTVEPFTDVFYVTAVSNAQSYRVGVSQSDFDLMIPMEVLTAGAGADGFAILLRVQNPGNTSTAKAYVCAWNRTVGYRLFKLTGGHTYDQIGSTVTSHTHGTSEYLRASAVGTALKVQYGVDNGDGTFTWTTVISQTDSSITGNGTFAVQVTSSQVALGALSGSVDSLPPSNTALPVISGVPTLNEILAATIGGWDGDPTSFEFQWNRSGVPISGADEQTYRIVDADVTDTITVTVTAINAIDSASATSSATTAVAGLAPVCVVAPATLGATIVGNQLSSTNGTWLYMPETYGPQWQRADPNGGNAVDIPGADQPTIQLDTSLIGRTLIVDVTAENDYGSATQASAHSGVVVGNIRPPVVIRPNTTPSTSYGDSFEDELVDSLGPLVNA